MHRTLSEHIAFLEQKVESLRKGIQDPATAPDEKDWMKLQIGIAEHALTNFQRALALETKLADPGRHINSSEAS